jgi:hypothetical protein
MAWKNLAPTDLIDAFIHHHKGLEEWEDINPLLECLNRNPVIRRP